MEGKGRERGTQGETEAERKKQIEIDRGEREEAVSKIQMFWQKLRGFTADVLENCGRREAVLRIEK